MPEEKICTWCQKVINSNPSYELVRITKATGGASYHLKAAVGLAQSIQKQVFHFHSRKEIVQYLLKRNPEE